jgi:hypothetical protein
MVIKEKTNVNVIDPLEFNNLKNVFPISNSADKNIVFNVFVNQFIKSEFLEQVINIMLYPSDLNISTAKTLDTVIYIDGFLKSLYSDVSNPGFNVIGLPKNLALSLIRITQQIVSLRGDVSVRLLSYDTILQHFPKRDMLVDKLLRSVISNALLEYIPFKKVFDEVIEKIQFFNDFKPMKQGLLELGLFLQQSTNEEINVFSLTKNYKDIISNAYNNLINLKTLTKNEQIDDYLCIDDANSVKKVVSNLLTFLESGYSFYKSGYSIIDDNILGIESSTMHLITGPSNHCKSIFMVNLAKNLSIYNNDLFQDGDAIVYITLEDDIHKLLRRFISIFGNQNGELVRQLFIKASETIKYYKGSDKTFISNEISIILTKLINESIVNTKDKKCKIIIKHCNENSFSMADATKFMDNLKLKGIRTKILLIDYVDVYK